MTLQDMMLHPFGWLRRGRRRLWHLFMAPSRPFLDPSSSYVLLLILKLPLLRTMTLLPIELRLDKEVQPASQTNFEGINQHQVPYCCATQVFLHKLYRPDTTKGIRSNSRDNDFDAARARRPLLACGEERARARSCILKVLTSSL